MSHICIYHGIDLDGWTSAAIVFKKFFDTELIPYNYGQPIPKIPDGHDVVICDVAFPMEEMSEIAVRAKSFTWIDHHFSNINKYNEYKELTDVNYWNVELPVGDELIGACELTWRHYNKGVPIPESVRLLGMYDSFRHKGSPDEMRATYFQYYAQSVVDNPIDAMKLVDFTPSAMSEFIVDVVIAKANESGEAIYKHKAMMAKGIYTTGFPATIRGRKFIMFNATWFNPPNFGIDYHKDGYDGAGSFWFDGKIWHLSLYSDDPNLDCSAICKTFGGGGHRGAAGCEPSIEVLLGILAGSFKD